jgi:hypothetical protein
LSFAKEKDKTMQEDEPLNSEGVHAILSAYKDARSTCLNLKNSPSLVKMFTPEAIMLLEMVGDGSIARPWFRQKPGSRPLFSRSRTSPNLAAAHGPAPVQATWQIRNHKEPRRAVRNFSLGPAWGWYFHLFCRPAPGE